jgi:hypothetical protein
LAFKDFKLKREYTLRRDKKRRVLTKHDGPGAVVGIKESDLKVVARLKLENSGRIKGYGFLGA